MLGISSTRQPHLFSPTKKTQHETNNYSFNIGLYQPCQRGDKFLITILMGKFLNASSPLSQIKANGASGNSDKGNGKVDQV